jgi:putative inorganic carbon (hco3(-)) transporter
VRSFAYRLYLLFVVSWFLHLGSRAAPLGALRLDLLLILMISAMIFFSKPEEEFPETSGSTERIIKIMFIYLVLSLPLVEWPGSVIRAGIPDYIKAVVFYFFTIALITSEKRLRVFMGVFLTCQAIRVIEPVVLHITTGYWGSHASMANWEAMDRLSGAPSDVVNPNGLAFVILMVFPFIHYLTSVNWKNKVIYVVLAPVLIYALMLTASRTGFVCLLVVLAGIWWKSKAKIVMTILMAVGMVVGAGFLSSNLKDRYLSLVSSDTKNSKTTSGRITQLKENLEVAMRHPLTGHGLGTSVEANANYGSFGKIAHNLYAEILQEIGLFGLIIFLFFMKSVLVNFRDSLKVMKEADDDWLFLVSLTNGMQVWMVMNIIFSFASFGFSSYEWYLFAGLSVVLKRICEKKLGPAAPTTPPDGEPETAFPDAARI